MKNKVALVTGANSGVGLELVKKLLSEDWQVIALIRTAFAKDEAQIVNAQRTNQLRTYQADLADCASLKNALERIKQREERIDVLWNNAGVSLGERSYSKQGREIHFEINTLVPYIIVMELKSLLLKGSLKTVINTSSNALLHVKTYNVDTLDAPTSFKKLLGPYADSKLALSLWTRSIAPSLLEEGIQIRSVCPGGNKTKMTKGDGMPSILIPIRHLFFTTPDKGAARLYEAAFGEPRAAAGVFLMKGKETPLPFADQAQHVLRKVHLIHKQQFQ